MKSLIVLVITLCILVNCKKLAGTSDDVNSGSIAGKLLTEGEQIEDSVTVLLYKTAEELAKKGLDKDSALDTVSSTNGEYKFEKLDEGIYHVAVVKDDIVIGGKEDIQLERIDRKTVSEVTIDISVVIIINQTFNIWNDQSQHITINNFNIENGKIESTDDGYVLTTAEADTVVFEVEVEQEGKSSVIKVRVIRNDDGTATTEIIDSEEDVDVIVTPDPDPPKGFLGTITIEVKNPGKTKVESVFDNTGVPEKSK